MRIRSIKPEYWRSDDITALPISTRLTFIGLWSYVDDNGVGADKIVSVVADLYADDFSRDPQETLQRVTADLVRLASGGQVVRFRALHNGRAKDLLYITRWKQHQVVNHPSLGHKYPLPPDETVQAAEHLTQPSGESLETLTHEQGNRGTGEGNRGAEEQDGDPLPEPPDDPYSEAVVVPEYIETPNRKPSAHPSGSAKTVVRQVLGSAGYPRTMMDRLAVQAEKLYREGHPDALIREALAEWDRRPNCDKPEFLPTVLGDLVKASRSAPGKVHKLRGYAELAQEVRDQEENNPPMKELA